MDDAEVRSTDVKRKDGRDNIRCRVFTAALCVIMLAFGFVYFLFGCLAIWAEASVYAYVQIPVDTFLKFSQFKGEPLVKSTLLVSLMDYTAPAGQIAFWTGLLMVIICSVGIYGLMLKRPFPTFMFAAMLLAKILVVSVIVVAFHSNPTPVIDTFKELVKDSVKNYQSLTSTDKHSLTLNVMMHHLQCCGVNDGEDFSGSKNFDNKYSDGETLLTLQYPYTCCKLRDDYTRLPNKCPLTFDDRNSNIKTGCWPKVETILLTLMSKVSYVVIVTTVLEFLLACCAVYASLTIDAAFKREVYRPEIPTQCPPPSS